MPRIETLSPDDLTELQPVLLEVKEILGFVPMTNLIAPTTGTWGFDDLFAVSTIFFDSTNYVSMGLVDVVGAGGFAAGGASCGLSFAGTGGAFVHPAFGSISSQDGDWTLVPLLPSPNLPPSPYLV